MAHFAELDADNVVLRVLVTDNNDPAGDEGYGWLVSNLGGRWVQTSYNGSVRNKFAGIGDTYDEQRDAFVAARPFASWQLDEATLNWVPPVAYPAEGDYAWDEAVGNWVSVEVLIGEINE